MKRLRDRVAVVTGAASGIGRATAVRLAEKGAHLALVDIDDRRLAETRADVERLGRRATTHDCDVADRARMESLVADVEKAHGAVHVLVNNAGVAVSGTFEDQSLEDFHWLIGINLWGVVHGCKLFLPLLRRADEAHIVNVSSVFGLIGMPLNSAYCASKFAVYGLSESLRAELSDTNIGVTCVQPGGIATNIVQAARFVGGAEAETLRARAVRSFRRMLPPEKAAEAIVRGIEKNSHRVLITREAILLDAAKRAFPSWSSDLVARRWRKMLPGILERVSR
ncbi:MAG: SDR family NAD(P)-dependent oxidoreductase [Polyangiaceae bacterium]|nr:SDR family NAD(P)-dependent oxidoreductase [Polyangiaceae bacterium]MCE7893171.1 SDR family NAD(P)-dependent oxidoreductase [Sorangiineae bacterium PRO1]MCL4754033.1 SDR family NAD(P)-dependent oxidoreductase [Myxococcales bacterium]